MTETTDLAGVENPTSPDAKSGENGVDDGTKSEAGSDKQQEEGEDGELKEGDEEAEEGTELSEDAKALKTELDKLKVEAPTAQ